VIEPVNSSPRPTDPPGAFVVYSTWETPRKERDRMLDAIRSEGWRSLRTEPEGIHGSERHVFVKEAT
jgi:hypothetical protein